MGLLAFFGVQSMDLCQWLSQVLPSQCGTLMGTDGPRSDYSRSRHSAKQVIRMMMSMIRRCSFDVNACIDLFMFFMYGCVVFPKAWYQRCLKVQTTRWAIARHDVMVVDPIQNILVDRESGEPLMIDFGRGNALNRWT